MPSSVSAVTANVNGVGVFDGVTGPLGLAAGATYIVSSSTTLLAIYHDPLYDMGGAACAPVISGTPVIMSGGWGFYSPVITFTVGVGCGIGSSLSLFDAGGVVSRTASHGKLVVMSHC
jgi:hypothetical protein